MTRWRVEVDGTRCTGSGMCAGLAPSQFHLAEGRSRPAAGEIAPDAAVASAAECCPMEAIVLTDVATGQPVFDPSDV